MSTINQRLKKAISLEDYCHNRMLRNTSATFVYAMGEIYYIYKGVRMTEKEYFQIHFVPNKIYYRENSDPSKKYLEDY